MHKNINIYKENWALKKQCFWTVMLKKTLESPLDCKGTAVPWLQPVNPKEIKLDYSLEGLMLKLQHFGHLIQRADLLEKTLMLGKIEGRRRRGWQRMRWLDGITDSMNMNLSKLWDIVEVKKLGLQSRIQLSDRTTPWLMYVCMYANDCTKDYNITP